MGWLKVKINNQEHVFNLSHVTHLVRLSTDKIGLEILLGGQVRRITITLPDNWDPDVAWNTLQWALIYGTFVDFTISQEEAQNILSRLSEMTEPTSFPEEGWEETMLGETAPDLDLGTTETSNNEETTSTEVTEVSPDAH